MENMKLYFMLAVLIIGRDYKKEVDYFLNSLHIQAYSPAKAVLLLPPKLKCCSAQAGQITSLVRPPYDFAAFCRASSVVNCW